MPRSRRPHAAMPQGFPWSPWPPSSGCATGPYVASSMLQGSRRDHRPGDHARVSTSGCHEVLAFALSGELGAVVMPEHDGDVVGGGPSGSVPGVVGGPGHPGQLGELPRDVVGAGPPVGAATGLGARQPTVLAAVGPVIGGARVGADDGGELTGDVVAVLAGVPTSPQLRSGPGRPIRPRRGRPTAEWSPGESGSCGGGPGRVRARRPCEGCCGGGAHEHFVGCG